MLEAVGFPVAVNPETKLATIARKRGWLIEDFRKSGGAPRKLLPIAPMRDQAEDRISGLLADALNRSSDRAHR